VINKEIIGLSLILFPIFVLLVWTYLQKIFEYPDILRRPTPYILNKFKEGGNRLIGTWYLFMLSIFFFIILSILIHDLITINDYLMLTIGVLAGIFQILGLLRWSFLVPTLANLYTDENTADTQKSSLEIIFKAFHELFGVGIGEHLGFTLTGLWTLIVSWVIVTTPNQIFDPLFGYIGLIIGMGIIFGVFEQVGLKIAIIINAISYMVLLLWFMLLGVFLIL
jgi:hypothetical protein